ncbi:immunity protein Imm33 domain-containing protein [Pseudomonas sp. Fl4BN1]|uniref:immunity protein Imm33 domain-containing protein n=1 Tax=Pseudomonas sp. Fl4BN1 TaxID=2697651 RepID=UPI0015B76A77|nr:hypothetical protein [Pseudomonas sp. Fl4BN1]
MNPRQKLICERYDLAPQAPEPMIALATGSLAQSPIYGTRVELPENGTVSWFFHCGEHSAAVDFYQPLCAEHLLELLPEVIDYLYLPSGTHFIIDRGGYEDVWRDLE